MRGRGEKWSRREWERTAGDAEEEKKEDDDEVTRIGVRK